MDYPKWLGKTGLGECVLSYGSSSVSEHDGDDKDLRSSLAEIRNRISLLACQCDAITRRNGHAQPPRASADLPGGVQDALAHFSRSLNAHFARRFEQISSTTKKTDASRPLNGQMPAAANGQTLTAAGISAAAKEPIKIPAGDPPGRLDQHVGAQFAEINKTLANITQKIAEQTARDQPQPEAFFEQIREQLAGRLGGIVQELQSDFDSKIAGLTSRFEQQISSGGGIRATEAAEREASLLAQIDKLATGLSDKYDREARSLARNLEDQLKRSFSGISLAQNADPELFINEFVDKIDGRLAAIAEQFSAELANMRKTTNAIKSEVDREIAGRANRKRADSPDAEVFVKKLQEHLDRCVSELTAHSTADAGKNEQLVATIKEQTAKLGKIERVVSALGQRVDGLIGGLAEADSANSARGTALVGSLENTAAALAEKSHADSQSLARILESNVSGLTGTTRAEAAKTTALIGSLDEKIAALAEKSRAETESLAKSLGEQIEGDVVRVAENTRAELARTIALVTALENKIAALAEKGKAETESLARTLRHQIQDDTLKLAENTRAEISQTIASVGALEIKIAALADRSHRDSAILAQTFQSSIQGLGESTRAENEKTAGLTRSLEAKVETLSERTQADAVTLAKGLSQQIESQALRVLENGRAESAKTKELIGSLEQKISTLAQTAHAQSEAVAKALHQKIESHARQLEENTQAQAANSTSFFQSLEKQIASSEENSRAVASKTTALLEEKIAALAEKNKADLELEARTLGQQIEYHVQGLTEYTRAEAARAAAMVGSLEHTVTLLAEKGRADSESLAKGLGQEIAGHVLRLTDSGRATAAKTLDVMGSLEDKIAALAEQSHSESESLARTLSEKIERHIAELAESTRAQSAAASALFENKIAALGGKVQTDTEYWANALSQQVESSVRKLTENMQADAVKTATSFGSLETKIAAMVAKGTAELAALAQQLTQLIESQALELGEKIRTESAGTTALLEQRIAALAESGKADVESLGRGLGQKIDTHVRNLAENTRAEAVRTTDLFENKITALAEQNRADTESVAKTLSQQIESRALDLSELTKAEGAKSTTLLENKIAALAEQNRADTESVAKTLSQQIESRALDLSELTKAEGAKSTSLLENKIAALAEQGRAETQEVTRTLGQLIETQVTKLADETHAEAARTSALFEERIAALAEKSEADAASHAKALSQQIESNVQELAENARTDAANTTALIGSLDEKIAAFAEKNRAALELQANALGAQLKVQLAELSNANVTQATELRKLLDTGIKAVEDNIATISEAGRAEFQSRFKAIDEQFRGWLDDLSQQNVARTEALAESLRHRIDLGVTALIEGSRAESAAQESLLRTLTEQIYRKVGAFSDSFRSEFENSHKKIDSLRSSIDHQFEVLAESGQEHFSRLTDLTGGLAERLDAAEAHLSDIEATHAGEAQPLRPTRSNGEQSHAPTNGHAAPHLSDGAEINGARDSEHLAARTHSSEANGHGIAPEPNIGEMAPTNGTGAALNGRHAGKSDSFHAEDPFDPIVATPEGGLVSANEEPSIGRPRVGYMRRLFRFNRTKN